MIVYTKGNHDNRIHGSTCSIHLRLHDCQILRTHSRDHICNKDNPLCTTPLVGFLWGLFSAHGAAALRAMGSIAQDAHSDQISAGCTNKPVAVHAEIGQNQRGDFSSANVIFHCDTSCQGFATNVCLHLSQIYFQY